MAAGATAITAEGSVGKWFEEVWTITTNGTTDVVLYSRLKTIIGVSVAWLEKIGGTGHVLECVISGSTVTVTCSGGITKDACITVKGYP